MRFKDYFVGQHIQLRSPLSAQRVIENVNRASKSALWPFSTGIVGGIWAGRVRLRYRSSPFEYNAKPVLSGRVQDEISGSTLDLRYRAPAWVYAFYVFWYSMLVLFAGGLVAAGWTPEVTGSDKAASTGIFLMLIAAPPGLHAIGTRHSEKELSRLLRFLSNHAKAEN